MSGRMSTGAAGVAAMATRPESESGTSITCRKITAIWNPRPPTMLRLICRMALLRASGVCV